MKKDYSEWQKLKQAINERDNSPTFFKEKEIWYFNCGLNVGHEQDGKGKSFRRPILILHKFNKHVFWSIPLTSSRKKHKFYFEFNFEPKRKSWAIISQIKLTDSKRLIEKIGKMSTDDFKSIKEKIRSLIE